jgi:hypothetical protein
MIFKSVGRPVVRSFIVRIHRSSPERPGLLLGEAEEVGKKGTRAFKTTEALWEIIAPPSNKRSGKAAGGGPADLTSLNQ